MPKKIRLGFGFWIGSILGILGGLLGELWITRWDEWMKNIINTSSMYTAIILTIGFLSVMTYMFYMFQKELKMNNP